MEEPSIRRQCELLEISRTAYYYQACAETEENLELMRRLAGRRHPLHAAGGIAGLDELRALAELGCHAAVLGMALYTGAFDVSTLAEEFAS